jgi:hypothetical protein
MKKLIIFVLLIFGFIVSSRAQVSISTTNPPYGWSVMTGAQRTVAVYPTGGATNKVNWSISSGGTISGCTSNCTPIAAVTITAAGGTCSVSGSVGSYVLSSTVNVTLTATSVDDGTKTATIPFHVCDTTTSAYVDVEPSYNQAYKGQQKTLQSYVIGYPNENVTWSIQSQPTGGNGTFVDTNNRDTRFSATVTGRYTLKATSVANGSLSGTAIVYVSPNAMPSYLVTPNSTEPTECYVDPALTGTDYEVGPARAYTTLKSLGTVVWTASNAGSIIRIHNDGSPGSPTTYHEAMQIQGTGTATQPIYFCGVALSNGELPVIDGSNATEDSRDDSVNLGGAGLFKFNYTNSNYNVGYEAGSTGPDYIGITGIRVQNINNNYSYYPSGSSTLKAYNASSGIWSRAGRHLHYEGIDMNNVGWGFLINNNTTYTGTSFSMFIQFIGNHIANFSDVNSYSEHAIYVEGPYNLIEGNYIGPPGPNDNGNFIKDRGGSSIIRYNSFIGQLSGNTIGYPDAEDAFAFESLDDNLGVPGSTSCTPPSSMWCSTTNNITIPHVVQNAEAQAHDYNYGNVYYNSTSNGFPVVQYGSDAAPTECPPCSNMTDRQGRLYFWNNTVHAPTYDVFTLTNPYISSYYAPLPQYSFRTAALYNNVFWPSTSPFFLNLATTDIYTLQTNMFETGVMSLTPTTGGSGGWDNFTGPYAYPVSTPISGHMSGLTSGNFLTTGTVPYSTTTYIPPSGSPLIGGGALITDAEIANMPVRFQPNVSTGYMTARTAGATTIGAETAAVLSPYSVNNTMTQAQIQAIINSADSTPPYPNTVTFAAGNYTGWAGMLQFSCNNGTIYTGPINSAGIGPNFNNQWVPINTNSPAVLNSDGAANTSASITTIQGGNSSNTTPGSGCTIENLTFDNDSAIVAGGDWNSNNPSYGILFQNNTIENLPGSSTSPVNGGTGIFFHNVTGYTVQNIYWSGATPVSDGTGGIVIGQNNANGTTTNSLCTGIGQCFGSSLDYPSGSSNILLTNNICLNISRFCVEITDGNSPGVVTGMQIIGNIYVLSPGTGIGVGGNTGFLSMACCYSGAGSFGYSYYVNNNVAIMNPPTQPTATFYGEELTGGFNWQATGNLIQGKWQVSGPIVAIGDVQTTGTISNDIIEGTTSYSPQGYFDCEYNNPAVGQPEAWPNGCKRPNGTLLGFAVTANNMSTSPTATQHATTAPAISPASGPFSTPPTVTFSNTQANVSYFYTTNGSTPTTASTLYTGSFSCASLPCTVKSISQWGTGATTAYIFPTGYGWGPSTVTTVTYTSSSGGTVATPTFSPVAGTYVGTQNVTISTTTAGAAICFTTDGSTPAAATPGTCSHGITYSGTVAVATSLTIKALGTLSGDTNSSVASAAYTINPPNPPISNTGVIKITGKVNY